MICIYIYDSTHLFPMRNSYGREVRMVEGVWSPDSFRKNSTICMVLLVLQYVDCTFIDISLSQLRPRSETFCLLGQVPASKTTQNRSSPGEDTGWISHMLSFYPRPQDCWLLTGSVRSLPNPPWNSFLSLEIPKAYSDFQRDLSFLMQNTGAQAHPGLTVCWSPCCANLWWFQYFLCHKLVIWLYLLYLKSWCHAIFFVK